MDQARARVSALQLARLEESSRRMATSLRRVEPKENQDPENHLIPGDWSTSRFREKTELHIVPPHPRRQIKPTTPMPIFLWDKLLGPSFRRQSGLKVLRVNTRFGSLIPGHLRSLRSVHLYELRLCGASGESKEACALSDVRTSDFGPRLRLLRLGEFLCPCSFLRFHLEFLLWNSAHHSSVVTMK